MAKEKDANDVNVSLEEFDSFENSLLNGSDATVQEILDNDNGLKVVNELNKEHIFVYSHKGKSCVITRQYDIVTRDEEIRFESLETFENRYRHKAIQEGKFVTTYSKYWLSSPNKLSVEDTIFDPTIESGFVTIRNKKYYNTWKPLITEEVTKKATSWKYTKKHIYEILCNSEPIKFKYLIKWLAWMFQNPGKKAEVAVVFKGEKGSGKTVLFEYIKILFGGAGLIISDRKRLTGQFSGHLEDICFLLCDEVYNPGDKDIEGRMKYLITGEFLDVESKGLEARPIINRLHIAMATNNSRVIPATHDERRFFICNTNDKYAESRASSTTREKYFDRLHGELSSGGIEAMLLDLCKMDLKGYHPRKNVPKTKELQEQVTLNYSPLQAAFHQMLNDGVFPGELTKNGEYLISSDSLKSFIERLEPKSSHFSHVRRANLIKSLGCTKKLMPGKGTVGWVFPKLKTTRKNWDKTQGREAWDEYDEWTVTKTEF